MAVANTSPLVLLDLDDEHKQYDAIYDPQILSRLTDKNRCVLHVLSSLARYRLLNFFIPNAEDTLIGARVILFKNTIFYVYCVDEASIKAMERRFNYPMFVKIFHADRLSVYLKQAALIYYMEQAERTKHEPDEHDAAMQGAIESIDKLAEELREHMIVKTGQQPEDRR